MAKRKARGVTLVSSGALFGDQIQPDLVNHPPQYTSHPSGVECIQITEHMNFNLGNVVKYVWRADEKGNAVEDLKKARWYLDREILRISSRVTGITSMA